MRRVCASAAVSDWRMNWAPVAAKWAPARSPAFAYKKKLIYRRRYSDTFLLSAFTADSGILGVTLICTMKNESTHDDH